MTKNRLPNTYEELYDAILTMNQHSFLYKTLRDGLKKRGNWKAKPRGAPRSASFMGIIRSQQTQQLRSDMHNDTPTHTSDQGDGMLG